MVLPRPKPARTPNVPIVLSEPLNDAYAERAAAGRLRSREIFDFALIGSA